MSTTEQALGGVAIAFVVIGIVAGILLLVFGGRKGYQYYKLNENKTKSVIKDNPMFDKELETKRESTNPFYQDD